MCKLRARAEFLGIIMRIANYYPIGRKNMRFKGDLKELFMKLGGVVNDCVK